jgi:hypothetical protein
MLIYKRYLKLSAEKERADRKEIALWAILGRRQLAG